MFTQTKAIAIVAILGLAACGGGSNSGAPPAASTQNPGTSTQPPTGPNNPELTSLGAGPYKQLDRLNSPAVNEVFATFAEHQANNVDTPNDDKAKLGPEIVAFMTSVAGRSDAIANVEAAVLTPDVQIVDVSGTSQSCIGSAPGTCNNYLGIETKGVTQAPAGLKPFGGRALTDDIVDLSLGTIFGKTIPALGLAPDDMNESDGRADASYPAGHRPNLTSDHVSYETAPKHFTTTFPYLGAPH